MEGAGGAVAVWVMRAMRIVRKNVRLLRIGSGARISTLPGANCARRCLIIAFGWEWESQSPLTRQG